MFLYFLWAGRPCTCFNFCNCPLGVFTYHGLVVIQSFLEDRQCVSISRISQCNRDVTQVTASLGALDWTPLEALIKLLGCKSDFIGQGWKRSLICKGGIAFLRKSIPWADHLADVASKNPTPELVT